MNMLFVCDEYPPLESGGYAQLCHELANGVRQEGHPVRILCTVPNTNNPFQEVEPVVRKLKIPISFKGKWPIPIQQLFFAPQRRHYNLEIFFRTLKEYQIDTVVFWPNQFGDTHLMYEALRMKNLLVAYYVAGVSPDYSVLKDYWSFPGKIWWIRIIKSLLRMVMAPRNSPGQKLILSNIMCVSEYERKRLINEGIPAEGIVEINNGIDPHQFSFRGLPSNRRTPGSPIQALYSGRLDQSKGAHTIIEALAILRRDSPDMDISLTILGTGSHDYLQKLNNLIIKFDLSKLVTIHSWIPRQEIASFMTNFDLLILPTVHPEPLARVVQEAMAIGLVVIATPTGGTPEIVIDGKTGIHFSPENPTELANCLHMLHKDLPLSDKLATNALDLVKSKFTIQKMIRNVISQLHNWERYQDPKSTMNIV